MLLDHCYAFGLLLYPSGLKKFLEEGDPCDLLWPALDPPLGPKNTNLVEDVFREECKNDSANQRQGQPSYLNMLEAIEILSPIKFH